MSSELLAKELGYGPICDNCCMSLGYHGDTMTGQGCDLQLAINDMWRQIGIAVIGERRYWEYKRRFEQLDPKGTQQ